MKKGKWLILLLILVVMAAAIVISHGSHSTHWRVPKAGSRIVIPVFELHRVLPGMAEEYIVSPEHLEDLLRTLEVRHFTPITLAQLRDALQNHGPLPKHPAMLTFDDAYLDNYTYAFPVLQRHGWTAVFFAPVGNISDPPAERVQGEDGPDPLHMQWPELIEMSKAGMEIGSHSVHHINLTHADPEALRFELEESRRVLAERLGQVPLAIAYPGGRQNHVVREAAAAAGYELGFVTGFGPFPLDEIDDLLKLPRVHVPGYVKPAALINSIPQNEWK